MLLEMCKVSRKTARDGKLEILPRSYEALAALGDEFPVAAAAAQGRARVSAVRCTCAKGGNVEGGHIHYFVESPVFQALEAERDVRVELDVERAAIRIEPA